MTELKKVEIELELLKRIAEYYEFPLVVFFGNEKVFPEKTREISQAKTAKEFEQKLKDLVEEYYGN